MQSNDPLVLLPTSSAVQLCVPVVHSSKSENGWAPLKFRLNTHVIKKKAYNGLTYKRGERASSALY